MLSFQIGTLDDLRKAATLFAPHWDEIRPGSSEARPDPDWDMYEQLEKTGHFHVVLATSGDATVGYCAYMLIMSLHHKTEKVAELDMVYLAKEHRIGNAGRHLVEFAEATMQRHGVDVAVVRSSLRRDVGALYERMGYEPVERVYLKHFNAAGA